MKDDAGRQFLARTKYPALGPSAQTLGEPQPPLESPADRALRRIDLPPPGRWRAPEIDLSAAIRRRRSLRRYAPRPLRLEELSYLLWCTQGVQEVLGREATLRTVPSAGARHAFETYLLVNRVEGLPAGLYRFGAIEHELAALPAADGLAERACRAALGQEFVAASAVTFFWAADVRRMTWRYGQRGYRYLFLDAGHVCQNLYLAAEAVGCGACAIAAFDDDKVNAFLGLDGEEQFAVYLAAVGKKP